MGRKEANAGRRGREVVPKRHRGGPWNGSPPKSNISTSSWNSVCEKGGPRKPFKGCDFTGTTAAYDRLLWLGLGSSRGREPSLIWPRVWDVDGWMTRAPLAFLPAAPPLSVPADITSAGDLQVEDVQKPPGPGRRPPPPPPRLPRQAPGHRRPRLRFPINGLR